MLVPWRYWSFADASAKGLIVGEDTSMVTPAGCCSRCGRCPGQGPEPGRPDPDLNYQTNAGSSVKWDTARAKALFTDLREDKPLESPPPGTDGKPSGG